MTPTLNDTRLPRRFWDKVVPDAGTGCWLWIAGKDWDGYGMFWWAGATLRAQRVAYEALVGPIPEGLQLDHVCRVRACVNPAHLEEVTGQINTLRGETLPAENYRKTQCVNGHELSGANLGWRAGRNGRFCKACQRATKRRHAARGRIEVRRRAAGKCIRCESHVEAGRSECARHLEIAARRKRDRLARGKVQTR